MKKQMGNALTCASSLRTIGTTRRLQESGLRFSTLLAVAPAAVLVFGRQHIMFNVDFDFKEKNYGKDL